MSRNFANSIIVGYRQSLASYPVDYCNPPKENPRVIRADIDWRVYGVDIGAPGKPAIINPGVKCDLAQNAGQAMTGVKAVFIDNTDVSQPVYVRADDTGYMVACADYSSGWFPILSSGSEFTVFIENVVPAYDDKSLTRVFFSNSPVPPYTHDQYNEIIPLSRVSGMGQYAANVIGDKSSSSILDVSQPQESGGRAGQTRTRSKTFTIIQSEPSTVLALTNVQIYGSADTTQANELTVELKAGQNSIFRYFLATGKNLSRQLFYQVNMQSYMPRGENLTFTVSSLSYATHIGSGSYVFFYSSGEFEIYTSFASLGVPIVA